MFSTQSLSVLRRRRSLALLRALGVTRGSVRRRPRRRGLALGVVGSLLGVLLGVLIAAAILQYLSGDLGNGQLRAVGASLRAAPLPLLAFFAIGVLAAGIGAWVPARAAARQPPARALKGGDGDYRGAARTGWHSGVALLILGSALAWLPPVGGLPVFGYAAIAALLFGAVLLVPALTVQDPGARAAHAPRRAGHRRGSAARERRPVDAESGIHHRELQSDGGDGHHGVFVPRVLRSLAGQTPAGRPATARALGQRHGLLVRRPIRRGLAAVAGCRAASSAEPGSCCSILRARPVTLIARGATRRAGRGGIAAGAKQPSCRCRRVPSRRGSPRRCRISMDTGWAIRIDLPLGGRERRIHGRRRLARLRAHHRGPSSSRRTAYIAATGDRRANEGSIWLTPARMPTRATERRCARALRARRCLWRS